MFRVVNMFLKPRRPSMPTTAPRRRTPAIPKITISRANKHRLIVIAVLAVIVTVLFASAQFWMQWWWYDSMGYEGVLIRRALLKASAFLLVTILGTGIVGGSAIVAFRKT